MPRYAEVRDLLKTGDLVLFSRKSWISSISNLLPEEKWTHVAMVLRVREDDDVVLGSPLRSNGIRSGMAIDGARLRTLQEELRVHGGEVTVRRLSRSITDEMTRSLASACTRLATEPRGAGHSEQPRATTYRLRGGEIIASVVGSELVAEAYQAMGLLGDLPDGKAPNEYRPFDFASQRGLRLNRGYRLGPEIPLRLE